MELKEVILFGIIPRALVLIAVAAIFTMLCSRTANMLSNLMGAEEQMEILDRMTQMKDKAVHTSETMLDMVKELSEIMHSSLKANREITEEAEQTKFAVENIGNIVHEVVRNTEHAVKAMDENVIYTKRGIESIQKANESSVIITSSNEELVGQVHEIDRVAENIRKRSGEVAGSMKQIRDNTQLNCSAAEHVSEATLENSAGTESLADIVEHIKGLSEELNKVVQE